MERKKSNSKSIGEAFNELLSTYHLDGKMRQVKLINSWEEIMGPAVAHRTTEISISGSTLFLNLSSASLRQELFQDKAQILELLNKAAGAEVIREIVFR